MKHWIDGTASKNNVIVANDKGLLIGSVDGEHRDDVAARLEAGEAAPEVLGTEGLTVLPYTQLQSLVARSTDTTVELVYRANGSLEHETLLFEDTEAVASFVEHLGPLLPETLVRSVRAQWRLVAAAKPALSLAIALGASHLYIDKARLPVYVIGGLWAAWSTWRLVQRIQSPPVVTRWTVKGKHVRKALAGIRTAYGYAVLAALLVGVSTQLPDSHGEKAVFDRYAHDMLTPEQVPTLVARGGDPSYVDANGESALALALYFEEHDIALALIEAGASLEAGFGGSSALVEALYNDNDARVVAALLDRGALHRAERDGFDSAAYLADHGAENERIADLLRRHRRTVSSGL